MTYTPGTEQSSRLRRIADHVRALTFCIADNALPSKEGRGYVVRRILRTALRDGVQLGHKQAFLHKLVPAVVQVMKKAYPYLADRRDVVEKIVKTEEESFLRTLEKGNEIIAEAITRLRKDGKDTLPGEDAFKLSDTYGFPIEMTEQILRDHRIKVDRVRFEHLMEEARKISGGATTDKIFVGGALGKMKEERVPATEFLGYGVAVDELAKPHDATVLRIAKVGSRKDYDGSKKDLTAFTKMLGAESSTLVESAGEGTDVAVLLDRTPFYGEGGGQVGDGGTISAEGVRVAVEDCKKPDNLYLHFGRVAKGTLKVGQKVKVAIDAPRRLDIMRNHTGTHILQAALRAVLGSHVQQAGSVVDPERLRFDFSHFQAVTPEEVRKIEDWVNGAVFADLPVSKVEMSQDEAKAKGAIAFFGEKYGDRVRVVTVGPSLSVEFCGGTHLEHAGTIGSFRITSESSIGSGIRRIEAVTGPKAVEIAREQDAALGELAKLLKSPKPDVPKKVQKLLEELAKAKSQAGVQKKGAEFPISYVVQGKPILVKLASEAMIDELRSESDREMDKPDGPKVGVFASASGAYLVRVKSPAKDGPDAKAYNELLKKVLEAKGGGRPDMVQGSFPKLASIAELEAKIKQIAW
jgi:alanyl-tRNA synthetase